MLAQNIYWKLPYFVKCWLASINASKVEKARYGEIFEKTLSQIAERGKWSIEQFYEYQQEQLRSLVLHAAKDVPYYRKTFAKAGLSYDAVQTIEDLKKLPILEKDVVRSNPESLVDETLDRKKLLVAHTSGTTGTPLSLYRNVWLNSTIFAYGDIRCHGVVDMHRRINRSVSIGGHLVVAPKRNRPPYWVEIRNWNQLYMSSYHLSPIHLAHYVDKLRVYKAEYIEGYPSSVYAVARYIVDNDLKPVQLKACFTTAETLFDYQRTAIKKAFQCHTYNQYGCGETVVFAAECSAGSMHLSPEVGIVEVVDDNDQILPVGQTGQLVCTSLINRVQPFIRYRLGDVGSLSDKKCSCSSPLPLLGSIEGRDDDILITRDGRRIGRLDPVFKGTKGIVQAQIVQEDYEKLKVRIIPGKSYKHADGNLIRQRLLERIGQGTVIIELVEEIERTAAGKFRAVVNELPPDIRNNIN